MDPQEKNKRIVEDYAKAVNLISPHLQRSPSDWYMFVKYGKPPLCMPVKNGLVVNEMDPPRPLTDFTAAGWSVHPVIVFIVDTEHLR
jgi:hypothetical protein